ncbi:MAG: hypothetical protein ABSF22_06225 [Bryobacteraceae bacterium]
MSAAAKKAYRRAKRAFIEKASEEALRSCDSDTAFEQLLDDAQSYSDKIFTQAQTDNSNSGSDDPENWPYNRRLLERTWEAKREFARTRFSKQSMSPNELALDAADANKLQPIPIHFVSEIEGPLFDWVRKEFAKLANPFDSSSVRDVLNRAVHPDTWLKPPSEQARRELREIGWVAGDDRSIAYVGDGTKRRLASAETRAMFLPHDEATRLAYEAGIMIPPQARPAIREKLRAMLEAEQSSLQTLDQSLQKETAELLGRRPQNPIRARATSRSHAVYGEKIKTLRGEQSQAAFARICGGISVDTLQRAELSNSATLRTLHRILNSRPAKAIKLKLIDLQKNTPQ